jgi:predicted component of type VI protein secretion system
LRMGPYHIRVHDSEAAPGDASAIIPYGAPRAGDDENARQRDIGVDLSISALLVSDPDQSAVRRGYDPWGNPLSEPGPQQRDVGPAAAPEVALPPSRLDPATPKTSAGTSVLEAFCRGAGLNSQQLPAEGQDRLLQLAGLLLREALVGIKALARTQREMRQDVGLETIAEDPERVALQNLQVEELLVRLLLGHEQRQLDAVQWMRELFRFASSHDAALMRALRPALSEFTQRLDPALLSAGAPGLERFRSITGMPEGRLPHLFAESLARSFNEEIEGGAAKD